MSYIVCSNNKLKVYKNVLNNTYKNRKIHYNELKSCIQHTWKKVKFVDIVIQNNEFNLQICCDEGVECSAKRYYFNKFTDEEYSNCDVSFVKVARELNEWHIGTFILEKIYVVSNGYDYDMDKDIHLNTSVIIPLGVPISRIIEFYGVRGL